MRLAIARATIALVDQPFYRPHPTSCLELNDGPYRRAPCRGTRNTTSLHLRVRPRGAMVYPHVRGQARSAMTTTDDSPDVTRAHNTAARNSASPILDAFDTIAAKGGDPKEIAGKQFQFIMEQI